MKGALIILAVTVVFGLVLYITHTIGEKRRKAKGIEEPEETPAADNGGSEPGCCGMHITCERDSLLQGVSTEIVYYDDEDLDDGWICDDEENECYISHILRLVFTPRRMTIIWDDGDSWDYYY